MKKTKIIIPALGLLLLSTAASVTGTVAWFAANASVTATGMQVTAKSNSSYLLIGNAASCASSKAGLTTTVAAAYTTVGNDDKQCYPTAYYAAAGTLGSTATAANKWYTANNTNSNNATNAIINVSEVTEGDKDYMLTYKMWLTLSADSEASTDKSIKVDFTLASGDAATSAVVVVGSAGKFALNSTANTATTSAAVSITSATAVEVTAYVYIDGNSTNVYSDYINTPNTITGNISLAFSLVAVPAGD